MAQLLDVLAAGRSAKFVVRLGRDPVPQTSADVGSERLRTEERATILEDRSRANFYGHGTPLPQTALTVPYDIRHPPPDARARTCGSDGQEPSTSRKDRQTRSVSPCTGVPMRSQKRR